MNIQHFVYGKFSTTLPDFGVRVCDTKSASSKDNNGLAEIFIYFTSHLRTVFYTANFPKVNPEIIVRIKDKYIYARFYPPFGDIRGTAVECLFHAFVFTKKDLELINYCPWRLKRNFIKEFNNKEIIGYDDEIWLKSEQCGFTEYNKIIDININQAGTKKNIDLFYQPHSDYYILNDEDPEAVLTRLDPAIRLSLFSSGILLNGNADILNKIYGKAIHFVFIPQKAGNLPDSFKNLSKEELNQLIPIKSAESVEESEVINDEITVKPTTYSTTYPDTIRIDNKSVASPQLTGAEYANGTVTLKWRNTDNFEVNILIERKAGTDGQFTELRHNIILGPHEESSFADTVTEGGREYTYRLQHYIAGTNPNPYNYTLTPSIKTAPLPVNGNTLAHSFDKEQSGNYKVTLRWEKPQNTYPVVYKISRIRLLDLTKVDIASNLSTENFTDTVQEETEGYGYRIEVIEPESGLHSLPVQFTCNPGRKKSFSLEVLNPPSNLRLDQQNNSVRLQWDNDNKHNATVLIRRKTVLNPVFQILSASGITVALSSGNYIDNNINNGEQYVYEVSFLNAEKIYSQPSFIETISVVGGWSKKRKVYVSIISAVAVIVAVSFFVYPDLWGRKTNKGKDTEKSYQDTAHNGISKGNAKSQSEEQAAKSLTTTHQSKLDVKLDSLLNAIDNREWVYFDDNINGIDTNSISTSDNEKLSDANKKRLKAKSDIATIDQDYGNHEWQNVLDKINKREKVEVKWITADEQTRLKRLENYCNNKLPHSKPVSPTPTNRNGKIQTGKPKGE